MVHDHQPVEEIPALNDLLAGYAMGTLGGPLHALVSAHLSLKPENRAFVRAIESLHGLELADSNPVVMNNRDKMLELNFSSSNVTAKTDAVAGDDVVPQPIASLMGGGLSKAAWITRMPGIREFPISKDKNGEVSLLWIKPGKTMPAHTHGGSEVTLVLKGGFTDSTGHYRRGDIAIADSHVDHTPRADDDEDCICFAVSEAPLRLTGPIARFVQGIFGH